jgi:hypothetical protein
MISFSLIDVTRAQSLLPLILARLRTTVRFSFISVRPPRGDNKAPGLAPGIDHEQFKSACNPDGGDSLLAIVAPHVYLFEHGPAEYSDHIVEVDSMLGEIGRILGRVPFKPSRIFTIVFTTDSDWQTGTVDFTFVPGVNPRPPRSGLLAPHRFDTSPTRTSRRGRQANHVELPARRQDHLLSTVTSNKIVTGIGSRAKTLDFLLACDRIFYRVVSWIHRCAN